MGRPIRSFWIIPLALALNITNAQAQYFPKSSLDSRGSDLKSQWYSSQLRALQEPSLLSLSKNPSAECYRFLEGVKRGRYHVVDRWYPRDGVARQLGFLLAFDLAKINLPNEEIY
jgi:hypothetical protein